MAALGEPPGPVDLAHEPDFALGPRLTVKPSSRSICFDGRESTIEPRLMQVLVALARARGAVLSREDLIHCCWAGLAVGDDSISRAIFHLRRLGSDTGAFTIETVPRVGYRLKDPSPAAERAPASRRVGRYLLAALAGVLVIGTAGWLLIGRGDIGSCSPVKVAVLPLDDYSTGGQGLYFGSRVADEIISRLSRQPDLQVAGRSSISSSGRQMTMAEMREQLRVSHLVEGSVVVDGERLQAIVRLLETQSGTQLWGEQFDSTPAEAFDLQKEVADRVALPFSNHSIRCPRA